MPLLAFISKLLLALALCAAAHGQNVDAGRHLFAPCATCHGATAEGNRTVQAPRIAGLPEWYLVEQLRNFRTGRRGATESDAYGAQMARAAQQLWDDREVASVAAYAAALPSGDTEATLRGKASRGRDAFTTCVACHGPAGEGNAELRAPPLRGLDDWYLVSQVTAFRTGLRGTHSEDVAGQQMRAAAATLTDEQTLIDLAAYVGTLREDARAKR
jgi:cytochrome c oxidase subunit 2